MSGLRLYLFGAPRLEGEGESLSISRRKGLAILAYVALRGQPQSRELLATLLWPDFDQSRALSNLRRELSRLKRDMQANLLEADRGQVALAASEELWVDVIQFQQQLALLARHDYHFPEEPCADCQEALTAAVALHTERFMAGFNLPDAPEFDDWQFFEAESLSRQLADSLQRLLQWYESVGEYALAIDYGRPWLALDTLHEPAHRKLMALYALANQQAAALRQYEECVRLLDEELGIEPEPETVALYEAIRTRQFPPREVNRPLPVPSVVPPPEAAARYLYEERIAVGGQGEVFRGRDTSSGETVIIKRLRPELAADKARVARFLRESQALRTLDHPNIVHILDTFELEGHHHIVMEYVAGGTLAERLQEQGPLPIEEVLALAVELADALARAHHLGIIHRDLKPGNVLLSETGSPQLTDFGIARLEREDVRLTHTGTVLGSPAYMSPEALRSELLDARSDIWSFGVLLYELLAGSRPFEGESISQVLVGILMESAPQLISVRDDLPPALGHLITQMLAKEREDRPASARLVAAQLEAIRAGKGEQVAPAEARRPQPEVAVPPAPEVEPARQSRGTLPSRPFAPADQKIGFVHSADGTRIAYATVGQGPPLVKVANPLTHLQYDWESPVWRHWVEQLSQGYTLIRYDERGCGLSDRAATNFVMEAWVSDLEAVVNALGLERFPILGTSQGSSVAVAYAARHPERVSHLICCGGYARGRFHRELAPAQREEAETLLNLIRFGWGKENPAFRQVFASLFVPDGTPEQHRWFTELARITADPATAAEMERAFYSIDVTDLAPLVQAPTLVLHPEGDQMVPLAEGRLLAELIPAARFVPLDSNNHLILEEEPAWQSFLDEVRGFLGTHEGQAERGSLPVSLPPAGPGPSTSSLATTSDLFIGREQELAEIQRLLLEEPRSRLLTIAGPGGIGKTRLAMAAMERLAGHFRDSAVFLPLTSVASAAQIGPALAVQMGLEVVEAGDAQEQWLAFLAPRQQLLVLDNFEHLLDGVPLVEMLLERAPGLTILATSREPLNLRAETVYRLGGLTYPEVGVPEQAAHFGAVDLLLQQVRRHRPDLTAGPAEMAQLVQICRLVGGVPLALVLAASWTELLTLEDIASEIAGSLDLLEADIRDLPDRQQSMRAVFNGSWEMLDGAAQQALGHLSVFRGSFSRPAAQAVAGCSLRPLRVLVEKSWLQHGEGLYEMHELVRQYAAERLKARPGALQEAHEAHAAYYLDHLQKQAGRMRGPQQQDAFNEVQQAFTQAGAAWRWLVQQGRLADAVEQLLPALYRYCEARARASELLPLLELALASPKATAAPELRDLLLVAHSAFFPNGQSVRFESPDNSIPFYWQQNRKSLELLEPERLPPFWKIVFCFSYGRMVDYERAITLLEALVPQLREAGEVWLLAFALQHLALLRQLRSGGAVEVGEALNYLAEALDIMEQVGDARESGYTLRVLGQLHLIRQELPAALAHWRDALVRLQQADSWVVATQLHWLIGDAYLQLGELEAAFRHYRTMSKNAVAHRHHRFAAHLLSKESYEAARYGRMDHALETRRQTLELAEAGGEQVIRGWYLWEMGELQRLRGELDEAILWFERALVLFNTHADNPGRCFYYRGLAEVARVRGEIGVAHSYYSRSLELAQQAEHGWAAVYAEMGLAQTTVALGEQEAAVAHCLRALDGARQTSDRAITLAVLAVAAAVLEATGNGELGVELAAFVAAHPVTWSETRAQVQPLLEGGRWPSERLAPDGVGSRQRTLAEMAEEVRQALSGTLSAAPLPAEKAEGEAEPTTPANLPDPFLHSFVARDSELVWLDSALAAAVAGEGGVCFIVGEAGQGKTTLLRSFIAQAQRRYPDLVAAVGYCNAYSGQGDPYLPFREILQLLSGGVDRDAAGSTVGTYTSRLTRVMPRTLAAVVDRGPELIERFLPVRPLLQRVGEQMPAGTAWLSRLRELGNASMAAGDSRQQPQQQALFTQYSAVLDALARQQPLLLCVDDLQWIDQGSANLLLHLSKRLAGLPLLIAGAYRPAEVAAGRGGERHPLAQVVHELQRDFGPIVLDLAESEGRTFVDALLDSEPNRLDERFRDTLITQTMGHPLFTVELLRGMQERGDLQRATDGAWIASATLDWQTLPARVEGAIGERIDRLDPWLREQLQMASVVGETFPLELLAQLAETDVRDLARLFGQELDRTHRLVQALGVRQEGARRLARYRFRHILIQRYLYQSLDEVERVFCHEAVAEALEALYGAGAPLVAAELARHFSAAQLPGRAAPYYQHAGDQARRGAALDQATDYYQRALAAWPAEDDAGHALLLQRLGECAWLSGQLLTGRDLYEAAYALYQQLDDTRGAGAVQRALGRLCWEQGDRQEAFDHYEQALHLLEQGPETVELAWVYSSIAQMHVLAWEHEEAVTWGERALALARRLDAPDVISHALNNFCGSLVAEGKLEQALELLREGKALALAHRLPHEAGRTFYNLAGSLISLDRYEETWIEFNEMLQHAQQWPLPYYTSSALAELAILEWRTGRWGEALRRLPEIQKWLQSGELLAYPEILNSLLLADIANSLGRPEAALAYLEQSAPAIERKNESQSSLPFLKEKIRALDALSRHDDAAAAVARMLALTASGVVNHYSSLGPLGVACCWAAEQGRWEECQTLLGLIATVRAHLGSPSSSATFFECEGVIALHQEGAEAGDRLRKAAVLWQEIGRPYDEARVQMALAQALVVDGCPAEAEAARARAAALLDELAEQLAGGGALADFRASPLFRAASPGAGEGNLRANSLSQPRAGGDYRPLLAAVEEVAARQEPEGPGSGASEWKRVVRELQSSLEAAEVRLDRMAQLEQELALARQVQQQMLPRVFPSIPGYGITSRYTPALAVGGDFYDVIPLKEGRVGLAIADVAGKGMPAALLMALTRSLLLAEAPHARSPGHLVRRVNDLLLRATNGEAFVTLFYGVLEPALNRLTYTRAGHDYPLLFRNGQVTELAGKGIPLGVLPGAELEPEEVELILEPEDRLVLYSDGLTDVLAPDGSLYGKERLLETLLRYLSQVCDSFSEMVFRELDEFRAGAPQYDDMTMLVLEVAPAGLTGQEGGSDPSLASSGAVQET